MLRKGQVGTLQEHGPKKISYRSMTLVKVDEWQPTEICFGIFNDL